MFFYLKVVSDDVFLIKVNEMQHGTHGIYIYIYIYIYMPIKYNRLCILHSYCHYQNPSMKSSGNLSAG